MYEPQPLRGPEDIYADLAAQISAGFEVINQCLDAAAAERQQLSARLDAIDQRLDEAKTERRELSQRTIDFVTKFMPRGGKREGAGGVSTWKHGKTKTIRVPVSLAEKVMAVARWMDDPSRSNDPVTSAIVPVTGSKILDLSRVSVTHVNGEIAVRLEDLVALGYSLQPQSLAEMVNARIRRKQGR